MQLLIFRHAKRVPGEPSDHLPLDPVGEQQAEKLGRELAKRGIKPDAYFTSSFVHAKQTAEILRNTIDNDRRTEVVELQSLTPTYQGPPQSRGEDWTGVLIPKEIMRELALKGKSLKDITVFVLHRPRVEQLCAGMTSRDKSEFILKNYSEGICLSADSLDDFLGKAQEDFRLLCDGD
jgi:phosphohistidine phosphatase SixA